MVRLHASVHCRGPHDCIDTVCLQAYHCCTTLLHILLVLCCPAPPKGMPSFKSRTARTQDSLHPLARKPISQCIIVLHGVLKQQDQFDAHCLDAGHTPQTMPGQWRLTAATPQPAQQALSPNGRAATRALTAPCSWLATPSCSGMRSRCMSPSLMTMVSLSCEPR